MGRSGKRRGYRPRTQREQARDAAAQAEALRQAEGRRRAARATGIGAAVLGGLLLLGILFFAVRCARANSPHAIVMQTPHETVSRAMFSYFYYDYLADYTAEGFDPAVSPAEQPYPGGGTYQDVILREVDTTVRRMLVFAESAVREGVSAEAAGNAAAQETVTRLQARATADGKTLDTYLQATYGRGVGEADVRAAASLAARAAARYETLSQKTYTKEERDAVYAENPAAFRTVDYLAYEIRVTLPEGASFDEARELYHAAEQRAQALAACGSEAAFLAAVSDDGKATEPNLSYGERLARRNALYRYHIPASDPSLATAWAAEEGRAAGDSAVLGATGNYTVVFLLRAPSPSGEHRGNGRYFLLPYADYLSEALAQQAAEELLSAFFQSGGGKEAFGALAEEHHRGSDSTYLTKIGHGDAEKPIADWLTASGRAPGDCAAVATSRGVAVLYATGISSLTVWEDQAVSLLQERESAALLAASGLRVYDGVLSDALLAKM